MSQMVSPDSDKPRGGGPGGMVTGLVVFAVLVVFYLATASHNHSTAMDAANFSQKIRDRPVDDPAGLREYLWITAMQWLYAAVSLVAPGIDVFRFVGAVNAAETALAVVLLQRLLAVRQGLSARAAWLTAALFAVSYGLWRYAAELEVYAASVLIPLILLHVALSIVPETAHPGRRIVLGAVLGALGTLAYEPMGIVAGLVIPLTLALRLPLWRTALYYGVFGAVLLAGLVIYHFDIVGGPFGIQSVFDTDGKPLMAPSVAALVNLAVGFLQNLLSINWIFAFGPTREILLHHTGERFVRELYAAQHAGPGFYVFLVTIPVAVLLLVAAIYSVWRSRDRLPVSALEIAAIVWLLIHGTMLLLIDPWTLFEPWIPALVPIWILLGRRLIEPLCRAGRSGIGVALVLVFLCHNWFAGVGIFAMSRDDLYRDLARPLIAQSGAGDLIVIGTDRILWHYLQYHDDARSLFVLHSGAAAVTQAIETTLARGGRVFVWSDVTAPDPDFLASKPGLKADLDAIAAKYLGQAKRIELGPDEYVYQVMPGAG